jgi:hypothetical protein
LQDLSQRHAGVTDGIAASYYEAIQVCFGRHYLSPQLVDISDGFTVLNCTAEWPAADPRTVRGWANKDDATEAGAYGVALAAVELTRGLVAVRRAETRTGADYYLGPPGVLSEDLEASFRLEVSGSDEGNDSVLQARLRIKIQQARAGNSNLPAIAIVVGFFALKVITSDI